MQINEKFLEPFSQSVLSSTYRALLAPPRIAFDVRRYVAEH